VMLITSIILIIAKKTAWGYALLINVMVFVIIALLEGHLHTYTYYGYFSY
jgi:hypothetical protein